MVINLLSLERAVRASRAVWRSTFVIIALGIEIYALMGCDTPTPLRRPSVRRCVIEVRYEPSHFPSSLEIEVEGTRAPLTLLDPTRGRAGLWGADVWTQPGWRSYVLRVDGRSLPDPRQPLTISARDHTREEQINSLVKVPDCGRGRWFSITTRQRVSGVRFELAYERALTLTERRRASRDDSVELRGVALDPDELSVAVNGVPHPYELRGELLIIDSDGLPQGKHHLTLSGLDVAGATFETWRAPFWVEERPHRWERGVMYQVVLDRLSPPEPTLAEGTPSIGERWGGQLDSLVALLRSNYLTELGVTALWLSPLSPNPIGAWRGVEGGEPRYEGYHGYWSIAPREVGEEWGDAETLERVVALAHARGIRVIVDVALNHVHEQHPYVDAYPEWFTPPGCLCGRPGCDWGTHIETCQFTTYLPDVRWDGLEVMRRQVDDALWWIERFDLDGLRVDAVPMMPRRVVRLLSSELRRRFEGVHTRHLLLGETFTGPREWSRIGWYLGAEGLDGQFDFPFMWGLREVLAWEAAPMETLRDLWRVGEEAWRNSGALMGRFVGNHDVTRFVSEARGDDLSDPWTRPPLQSADPIALGRLWLASALTLTLPGIPVLYYGDEVGLAGANDPDNRRPLWPLTLDAPNRLAPARAVHYERIARLGRLRSCLEALSDPEPEIRFLASSAERLSFIRGHAGREVIVIAQRAATLQATTLAFPLPQRAGDLWVDLISGVELSPLTSGASQITQLSLPPLPEYSFYVLARRGLSETQRCSER